MRTLLVKVGRLNARADSVGSAVPWDRLGTTDLVWVDVDSCYRFQASVTC